jgi:hypothetical protein
MKKVMWKIGILVMIACGAMMIGGASCLNNIKTDVVDPAKELLCNPTPQQKMVASVAIIVIKALQPMAEKLTGLPITLFDAEKIFTSVANGTCVLATDLANALSAYDLANAQKSTLMAAASPGKKLTMAPPLSELRVWTVAQKK